MCYYTSLHDSSFLHCRSVSKEYCISSYTIFTFEYHEEFAVLLFLLCDYRDNMKSKGDGVDSPANGVVVVSHAIHAISEKQEEDIKLQDTENSLMTKVQQNKKEEILMSERQKSTMKDNQILCLKDLSKDDLLKLLGIMEGEIQVSVFYQRFIYI